MIGCLCSAAWAARPLIAVRPATNPSASVTPEWECVPTTVRVRGGAVVQR
jgi:hypothetical protein